MGEGTSPWRLLSVADRPPAAGGMQGGATARLACAPCRGCWLGKLGRAGWHAALTGKAGTCQLRQTPWHSAQTVSARPRSCWSLSAPSGMPPLPHCACAPAHGVHRHRVCRVRVVLTRCLPLRCLWRARGYDAEKLGVCGRGRVDAGARCGAGILKFAGATGARHGCAGCWQVTSGMRHHAG